MKILSASLLLVLCGSLMLGACASRGNRSTAAGDGEPVQEGIQTRSIRAAPPSRQLANDSRPLSELDTPEAAAAREIEARSARPRPVTSTLPPAMAGTAPSAPLTTRPAPAAAAVVSAHDQRSSLQPGSKVRVRNGAMLRARPSVKSDGAATAAGTEVELGAQIYNADGYWYYVKTARDSGWLLQTDIQG